MMNFKLPRTRKRGIPFGFSRMPKMGIRIPNILKDSDKDGYPNVVDCKPYNPRRQGIEDTLNKENNKEKGGFLRRTISKLREGASPEKRIERLKRKTEIMQARKGYEDAKSEMLSKRYATEKQRLGLRKERMAIYKERMKTMPSITGGVGKMPSSHDLFQAAFFPSQVKKTEKKADDEKKKSETVQIGGRTYKLIGIKRKIKKE